MTLQEKFAALTPEQQEKFLAVENEAEFDALLKEAGGTLTGEERSYVLTLISNKSKLSDEELDSVGGGCGGFRRFMMAIAQPTINSIAADAGLLRCPKCCSDKVDKSVYDAVSQLPLVLVNPTPLVPPATYHCKNCGYAFRG